LKQQLHFCHIRVPQKDIDISVLGQLMTPGLEEREWRIRVPLFMAGHPQRDWAHSLLIDVFNDAKDAAIWVQSVHDVMLGGLESQMT